MIIQTLVYIYGFILLVSSVFTFFLYQSYREKLLKLLLYFWLSGLASFVVQGIFNKDAFPSFLAFTTNAIPVYLLLELYYGLAEKRLPIKRYSAFLGLGFIASVVAFSLDLPFTFSSSFFCISIFLIILKSLIRNTKKNSHPLFKGFTVLLFLNGLHFLDYPFVRVNPELAVMGFSIALGFYFIYSIYIPLFTMQKIAESYSTGLEKQVQDRTYELMKSNELLSISNNELKNLNTNLASVTRENQMLLSILVHDISNPVQVIMSFVEKATKAEKSPSNSMYEKVKNALGTILDTLSTVKSYHSVRVGKILPKAAELDIVETVRSVVSQFEEKITAKNLKLEIAVQPDCRTLVVSDKTWIKNQIFSNILSNAIKFSYPNEPIKINVSSVKSGVCVSFRDFGPGIPEDAKRNIFSSSVSTTTLGTQGEKGTGLGMPIVKDYVVRLNGTVEIINLPEGERGTCFQIYIPYEFKKPESL